MCRFALDGPWCTAHRLVLASFGREPCSHIPTATRGLGEEGSRGWRRGTFWAPPSLFSMTQRIWILLSMFSSFAACRSWHLGTFSDYALSKRPIRVSPLSTKSPRGTSTLHTTAKGAGSKKCTHVVRHTRRQYSSYPPSRQTGYPRKSASDNYVVDLNRN